MRIRELIKRDIGEKIEGIVKVFDRESLYLEFREYVLTDRIEEHVKEIIDCFTQQSEVLRRGANPRDVMGIWISGFFGSGKSHFAKVLGYLFQNEELSKEPQERCIDVFAKHLSDSPRGKSIALRLKELEDKTRIRMIPFEIKSRQSLTNPNSVGEIMLSEFYRHLGLAENFVVARLERRLQRRGYLERLEQLFEEKYGIPWRHTDGRDDLATVRRRLSEILPQVDPENYPNENEAKNALSDLFKHEKITAEGIAEEFVAWVDAQKPGGGKTQHLVFVIDEMGTFIGDSTDKISELNAIAEMIGNKGKGKVWLIATSQQDLERVVDRTNFQPALVGRLNARFELKPHLISDEINKVVSERILQKHPSEESRLRALYRKHEGHIALLSDLKATRHLALVNEESFVAAYPFLPHQIQLAQDIFEALSGFRISGGVRSMISVVMEALQDVADQDVGTLVSFDQVFDVIENDLLSQEYLGSSGVRAISESDKRVMNTPLSPARVLKVLWLLQQITWVPRIPETLAKLLVRDLETEIAPLRKDVEDTLEKLQEAGYVAKDEATGEWKYLNERERTIERAIQEMVRPGSPKSISLAVVRRRTQELCKDALVTKKKLNNFALLHGKTKVPFPFDVYLDGEAVETGADLEVAFISPLAAGRKDTIPEIQKENQASGVKGQKIWWVSGVPENLEVRFRRYEALLKVTADKRFTDDTTKDMQDALSEKRKERDELKSVLVDDLEKAFLQGALFYAGQEVNLEGDGKFWATLESALSSVIPNIYPLFPSGDREYDFAKHIKGLLNPGTSALHEVAPNLDLFDTQGSLQKESVLVSQVLEVLADLQDEGVEPVGSLLLDAKERKGFKGFSRPPFNWPGELVRLVLAACLRAGAVYLEEPTGAGLVPRYEYRDAEDLFSKINTFKKIHFRIAESSLSVDQIKEASKLLVSMDVKGTPESGNAIAEAVRKLGGALKLRIEEAKRHSDTGLPLDDELLAGESVINEAVTHKDPTKVVLSFLDKKNDWKGLYDQLVALRTFLEANRHKEFHTSRKIAELGAKHPLPKGHSSAAALEQALKDMETLVSEKQVISRWADYRSAYESARDAYRKAYKEAYEKIQTEAEAAVEEMKKGSAYKEAPGDLRDAVIERVFGLDGPCYYPELSIISTQALLDAAAKHSLTSLGQALMALPGYQSQVEAELRALTVPPLPPGEKTWEWRPGPSLAGRTFRTEKQVDDALENLGDEVKEKIREGFTVVVK
jgi:hypothetical protein